MNCALCKKIINKYQAEFNHLIIDESVAADVCSNCVDKFLKWRQDISATLFPTKNAKQWFKKNKLKL